MELALNRVVAISMGTQARMEDDKENYRWDESSSRLRCLLGVWTASISTVRAVVVVLP